MNDSIKMEFLKEKIIQLESSLDSIKNSSSIRQLEFELNQKQEIIGRVNEFYDSAWLKLIIVISILGILVPIIAQYFQRLNLKELTNFIGNEIKDRFDTRLSELKEFNNSQIEIALKDYKNELSLIENSNKNILNELDASTYYLQGRASLLDKQYELAMVSFIKSANLWLISKRPERSKVLFVNMKICLKKIEEKKVLDRIDKYLQESDLCGSSLEKTLENFKLHDHKEYFYDKLIETIEELKRIKKYEK